MYQKYLYFSSQFDDIDMTALEIGSKLLTLENQLTVKDISEEIDEMVQLSGIIICIQEYQLYMYN